MPRALRLSLVEYVNAAPLTFGLREGLGRDHVQLRSDVPSACAEALRTGEADAAIVSSIEYLRIPGLRIVPGLCISSPKRVRSVGILSKVPTGEIRTLALDTSSRSSVALAQILLRDRYGADPTLRAAPPDLDAMLRDCDAAVLIGDAFMRARREGLLVLDLAEEWHAWTGLPFVFALWVVREDAPEPRLPGGLAPLLHRSLAMGVEGLAQIVEDGSRRTGWTRPELRQYLTESIRYRLGEAEQRSLRLFFDRAVHHGLAPAVKPLRFL